jgi:hypothetical protein
MIGNRDNSAMTKKHIQGNRVLAAGLTLGLLVLGLGLAVGALCLPEGETAGIVRALGWCCMVAGGGALALGRLTRRS